MAKKKAKIVETEVEYTPEQEVAIQAEYDAMSPEEKDKLQDPSMLTKKPSRKQELIAILNENMDLVLTQELIEAIVYRVYPAVQRERKSKGPTIAHTIIELMLQNAEDPQFTDEEIVAVVQQEFENAKADKKHVAYYRSAINQALKDVNKARHLNLLPVDEDGKPDLSVLPLVKVVLNSQNKKVVV